MADEIFDSQSRAQMPADFDSGLPSGPSFFQKNKVIVIAVLCVIIVVGIFWLFLSRNGSSNKSPASNVILTIKGPDQSTSGNEAEYTVSYVNGENAGLVSPTLEMLYPNGFTYKSATPLPTSSSGAEFSLPPLKEGASGTVVIRGKLNGATNEDKEIKAILHYHLSNFNSEFVVAQSIHTKILAPNLVLDVNGPLDVVNGQDSTFNATVTNVSGAGFDNLALQLTYPTGFVFTSSNVKPSQNNNYWNIGHLDSNASQSIEITGSFTGQDNEEKLVRADLGEIINNNFAPQIASTSNFKVIPSSLVLSLTSKQDNFVVLGDTISYKLDYENRGTIGLSNLVVSATIDSLLVDYARISASNSIVNGHTLIWKAATFSDLNTLAPNQKGEITFTVPVKQTLSANLKNQTIKASANIVSDEINTVTRAADLNLKLISQMDLTVDGNYISGANPMTVGQTTLFNISFLLSNLSNDLSNTQVVASLPLPASAWNNVIVPDSEASRLSYDPGSGKITWRIGDLAAFTGKTSPALKVNFQLAVTPSESDRGKIVNFLKDIQATATDNFVNQTIQTKSITAASLNTFNDDAFRQTGTTVK